MNLVESVFEISEKFMTNSKDVFISHAGLHALAEKMKQSGPTKFPTKEQDDTFFKTCLLELIGNSINYCYWYGVHNCRPGGASSSTMGELLEQSFEGYHVGYNFRLYGSISGCIEIFKNMLIMKRFPLIDERVKHLGEIPKYGEEFIKHIIKNHRDDRFDELLDTLVCTFPGYGSDMFLKRASLFFLQLNRNFGWFEETMHKLHVPADYQVPKILRHFDCIRYTDKLADKILEGKIIKKHSLEELQIRAATVKVCTQLQYATGWTIADVDTFLWTQRKLTDTPFHLTYTTDY